MEGNIEYKKILNFYNIFSHFNSNTHKNELNKIFAIKILTTDIGMTLMMIESLKNTEEESFELIIIPV